MTLAEEYEQQNQWRNWHSYLSQLPIKESDIVLDMGCGTGQVTRLLAERCLHAIGIDHNLELLRTAKENNNLANVSFINSNLSENSRAEIPLADGIWCSFTAAYFPDFQPVLSTWLQCLKPGGWIALIDIDNLFGHNPLSIHSETLFRAHYKKLRDQLTYDFEMGSKLNDYLVANGLTIIYEQNMKDAELSFNGPADNQVLISWQSRLDRMTGFKNALGSNQFERIKNEFLNCLSDNSHTCNAIVKYVIATKDHT
jgi:ubiquinone/menaquinone biosynthesis C-methylase UbiE